jgi:endonuclease/exonuclease/phosphatase family metal-dependent hydrolase
MSWFVRVAGPRALRYLLVVFVAAGACGCASAINFTDPAGPGFIVRYAPARSDAAVTRPFLRVVTFNVKFAEEIDAAIAALRGNSRLRDADLIALQEMDDRGVERMARSLSLNAVYYAASIHPTNRKMFGPALLTPWPVERGWKVLLPHEGFGRRQRRTATGANVRVGERLVRAYSVHLETLLRMSEGERRDQAAAVIADAAGWNGPVVVAGDMNDYRIPEFFEAHGFLWANREAGASTWLLGLDHVFVRGLAPSSRATRSGVEDPSGASDHKAVWVEMPLA